MHALYNGAAERIGSNARAKLLAFNELTESDLANRPEFVLPDPGADPQDVAARFASCRLPKVGRAA